MVRYTSPVSRVALALAFILATILFGNAQAASESEILQLINNVVDKYVVPGVNTAISNLPDPIDVYEREDGSTGKVCILPSPLGCICKAKASYWAEITTIYGVNNVVVGDMDVDSANINAAALTGTVDISGEATGEQFTCNGKAGAGAGACGINVKLSGSASATMNTDADVSATGSISPCSSGSSTGFKLAVYNYDIKFSNTKLTNIKISIDGLSVLGPLIDPVLNGIADLIQVIAPSLASDIANSISPLLEDLAKSEVDKLLPSCILVS